MSDGNDNDDKVIQIIPAPSNTVAVYGNDDGTVLRGPVMLIALRSDGGIQFMSPDDGGYFDGDGDCSNFVCYEFEGHRRTDEELKESWAKKRKRQEEVAAMKAAALPAWKQEKIAYEQEEGRLRWQQKSRDKKAAEERALEAERLAWEQKKKIIGR